MSLGGGDQSSICLHNFSERILDRPVHFHVMKMRDCFFLWVGAAPQLTNLAVAMCSKLDSSPVSTLILGDASDTTTNSFAQRLAKKTKKQVFASYNLPNVDASFSLLVEDRIKKEMEAFPDKF
ncbi:proteasome assembly chaperone 4 [Latimeria chalumnae]|uniref:Proteasome assembly chaperone 4 n=1 Tax=Latimeria chalumnae TaxID=7897 RepID=H3ATV6_LATCH|nr:PREDICTED: proteasome assembly chaperone 4 [Latimeria chalumnae]|eukprot:XP_006004498.1 PREDICTED: proteasome assembly chaperone 4 [Latimeria chalumnae]